MDNAAETRFTLYVEEQHEGRIDKLLAFLYPDYSRSYLQRLIGEGRILVDGQAVKSSFRTQMGQLISIDIPRPKELCVEPENIDLDILYEDQDILIVNKPKGMVVHPAPGHEQHTLVNALLYHCKDQLSGINGVLRPGIVHRIDKDTTGSLIICKNDAAHRFISEQLKDHHITRIYEAIVCGHPAKDTGTIEGMIGRHPTDRKKMSVHCRQGKRAVTHYQVLEHFRDYSHISCELETGRTHQIRVHMSSIGHPILGDPIYGRASQPSSICRIPLEGQTLHARTIGFIHPSTKKYVEFEAPLPDYFRDLLARLPK